MTEIYYNGDARPLFQSAGHHLHDRQMRHVTHGPETGMLAALPEGFPIEDLWSLDGSFAPELEGQPEGIAALHHLDGWTVLAFWDRSGDRRGNSNSAFVIRGELSFIEAVEAASETFPRIWDRFDFEVIEQGAAGCLR